MTCCASHLNLSQSALFRGETFVSGLRHIGIRLILSLATIVLLTGCCSTCPSISGRLSDSPLPTPIVETEGSARIASPIQLHGSLKAKLDERGRKSGCGEFFWSSWYNDGPEHEIYQVAEPCHETETVIGGHVNSHPSSKPSHRIISSRQTVRLATAELDDEI